VENSIHIGDGAYVTFTGYSFLITANHHDPAEASDTVAVDACDVHRLIAFIESKMNVRNKT